MWSACVFIITTILLIVLGRRFPRIPWSIIIASLGVLFGVYQARVSLLKHNCRLANRRKLHQDGRSQDSDIERQVPPDWRQFVSSHQCEWVQVSHTVTSRAHHLSQVLRLGWIWVNDVRSIQHLLCCNSRNSHLSKNCQWWDSDRWRSLTFLRNDSHRF